MPWPANPLPERTEQVLQQEQAFHQLLERHFLGLKISPAAIEDGRIQQWWRAFQTHNPVQTLPPNARFLPETGLTVPLGNHLLYGRFDLLAIGEDEQNQPFAHVFDWKTGRPIAAMAKTQSHWQTHPLQALLAEEGSAFWSQAVPPRPRANPPHLLVCAGTRCACDDWVQRC